jgi:hypothetical protein
LAIIEEEQELHVSTFWHGAELSSLEIACLLSFVRLGHRVTVFGYSPIKNLPSEITFVDAEEILESSWLDRFRVRGKPSLQHFSDLFRYVMIRKTGSIWIDADLVCLKKFFPSKSGEIFGLESGTGLINNAILAINNSNPALDEIIERAKSFGDGNDHAWGSTGPGLLARILGHDAILSAEHPSVFYPIDLEEWWKLFLPNERIFCKERCARSATIHLWNNKIEKSGYWKDLAPPAHSFLNELFRELDLLGVFKETCPQSVMTQIAENYESSKYDVRYLRLAQLTKITTARWMSAFGQRIIKNRRVSTY